jgi:hypothetical protein
MWRTCFVAAGALIAIGGPMHPKGTTEQMLANPAWIPGHLLVLGGFVSLLAGLILYRRSEAVTPATRRALRIAAVGTLLQVIEMAFHAAAAVDHDHLVAGHATPILTTHLTLALFCYPAFAASMIWLIVTGVRERSIGSKWTAPLGVIGAVAHGMAPPLVVGLDMSSASVLFPMLILLAVWMIATGLLRRPVHSAAAITSRAPVLP